MDPVRSDISHLYRRAGFGIRPAELDAAATGGYQAAVEELVAGLGASDPAGDAVPLPALQAGQVRAPGTSTAARAAHRAERRTWNAELRPLQVWWADRMIATSTPLREKLALIWHGHFATAAAKVGDPWLMYHQNQVFRTAGAGSFAELTRAMAHTGAMMKWLDTSTDRVGHPNENFARELLERFTLGTGQYTQDDVTAAARAFTGWHDNPVTDAWSVRPAAHDDGTVTFLGHRGQLSGDDVIDLAVTRPASARFVASRLWSHLAWPVDPSDPVVTDLVGAYGPGLDLTSLVRAALLHPAFRSPAARSGLVKQPIEYLVGAARALGLDAQGRPAGPQVLAAAATGTPATPATPATGTAGHREGTVPGLATTLGQTLFDPPNVGGWGQNAYWLDTATADARFASALWLAGRADLSGLAAGPASGRAAALADVLGLDGWGPTTAGALAHAAGDPVALTALALTSPEYTLN